jgi:predicted ATPase
MNEYLCISNFGPIDYVELKDIRPFTVLIGESGSGKSTVMKVLSLFRWLYKRENLRSFLHASGFRQTTIRTRFRSLLKVSGIDEFLKGTTEIVYRRDNYEMVFRHGVLKLGGIIKKENLSLEKVSFISDKRAMIPDFLNHKSEVRVASYYLQDTFENFLLAKDVIKSLSIDYLGIQLRVERIAGIDYYKVYGLDDSFKISMQNASSGMQTVLPLSMIVEYFSRHFNAVESINKALFKYTADTDRLQDFRAVKNLGDFSSQCVHLMIEEPELSLYSESQLHLIDFLVRRCFLEDHSYKMTLMLATHSPYIVNYLNLLIRRAEVSNYDNGEWMPFADVDAYEIVAGTAVPIKLDGEQKLVNAKSLSEPISDIYRKYNQL